MLYPSSEISPYPEMTAYQELLYDDVRNSREYEIQVVGHNKIKAPSETFIEYDIITERAGQRLKVQRRYSDFEWLMNYLYKKYPFQILPPMPPKRFISTVDKFSRPFIDKRQVALNAMIQRFRSLKHCMDDERTQIFLKQSRKEFDQYRASHPNHSMFSKLRQSVQQLYAGTVISITNSNGWKDADTISYIKLINKRAMDRSIIMSILESFEAINENWEGHTDALLLLAQDLSDVVLLMKRTELTVYIDGSSQLLFNLSTEGKLHCSFMTATIQPILFEYISYNDQIMRIIKRRNRTQATYYSKSKSIQLLDATISSNDMLDMPKGNKLDQLTQESIMLVDNLKQFDNIFLPDLASWERQRSVDMARCLSVIVTSNLKYHKSCLDLCKHVLNKIKDDVNDC